MLPTTPPVTPPPRLWHTTEQATAGHATMKSPKHLRDPRTGREGPQEPSPSSHELHKGLAKVAAREDTRTSCCRCHHHRHATAAAHHKDRQQINHPVVVYADPAIGHDRTTEQEEWRGRKIEKGRLGWPRRHPRRCLPGFQSYNGHLRRWPR